MPVVDAIPTTSNFEQMRNGRRGSKKINNEVPEDLFCLYFLVLLEYSQMCDAK